MAVEQERKHLAHPACEAAAATHPGKVRSGNEDAYGMSLKDGVFLVCDGMGGAAAGEVASDMTVSAMLASLADWSDHESSRSDPAMALHDAIAEANHTLYSKASKDNSLHGMGTTLVALALVGDSAWIAHVGDSRCYMWRDGALKQCTLDHSLVDEQVRMGSITAEEAARSPLRNVITKAVGSQKSISPDVSELPLANGDVFLLCSDGLTRELDSRQIVEVLESESDLQAACTKLIDRANLSGGRDNITCVLVRVCGSDHPDPA